MNVKNITYNLFQLAAIINRKRKNYHEVGRGGGKTVGLGRYISDCIINLPRSKGILVGATYKQILTRILPTVISGLEIHGLYKDVHFFVGSRAPKHFGFPEPYMPPLDYKHAIHFWTGAVLVFVSQEVKGDGRGLSSDWVVGDEAGLLDKTALDNDVSLTLRGTRRDLFCGNPLFLSETYCTSTPVLPNTEWWYDMEQSAIENPDKVFFIRAPSFVNKENLGDEYFADLKRILPPAIYDAEVLCKRVVRVPDCFYSLLDIAVHTYTNFNLSYYESLHYKTKPNSLGDDDCNRDLPLILGVDWGASINCLVVAQMHPQELRFLKNMYVLGKDKKIIDDLADDFLIYYEGHRNKTLYLCYDNTGNNQQANSYYTLSEQFSKKLRKKGWSVLPRTIGGTNPHHSEKHRIWTNLMRQGHGHKDIPFVTFNRENCKELLISMGNARTKHTSTGFIQKDKSSERKLSDNRQHATDLSDAADTIVWNFGQNWGGQREVNIIF